MARMPRIAIAGFVFFLVLIGVGCFLAFNTDAENKMVRESVTVETHANHFPGLESIKLKDGQEEQLKDYTGFKVSFNKNNHTPNYVAWELLGTEISNEVERSNKFWQDYDIEGCPSNYDYTHSGYDRGHMCPAADQKWSEEAMNDCFVMANMCPQDHQLNAGAWNTLENKERQWALRDSAIVIIAGPIYYGNNQKTIGEIGVKVPDAFFKAILAPYVNQPRAIAFVFPNMTSPDNMQDYAMSIDDLEEYLGYDLFYTLPDDIENKVEANFSFKEWNRTR